MPTGSHAATVRALLFFGGYLIVLRLTAASKGLVPPPWANLTWGVVATLGLIGLTWGVSRLSRPGASAPLALGTAGQFASGLGLGLAVYTLILVLVALAVGPLRIRAVPPPAPSAALLTMLGFVALTCMEEVGFRGYPLRTLAASVGARTALGVTALAFAASHVLYGWPWPTVLLGVLPMGVLFGVAALVSGGLALPIGLHVAINVARWIAGEQGTPGYLTLSLAPSHAERAAMLTAGVGVAVPLLVGAALWRWYPRP